MSSADYIRNEVPHWCEITVWKSEDMFEAVPQMVSGLTGDPIDLSTFAALEFNLWIKPTFDTDADPIALLSSRVSDGIIIDSLEQGLISLQRDRSVVNTWPVGSWVHFLNMTWTEGSAYTKTLWQGPFHVRPGRFT